MMKAINILIFVLIGLSANAQTAYIANWGNSTLNIIDVSTNTVTDSITGISGANGISVSLDGTKVYVASNDGSVIAINTATNIITSTIPSADCWGIVVSPDGSKVYVANSDSNSVSVINTSTDTILAIIHVGVDAAGVCVSPDGTRVYVTNYNYLDTGKVSVINTSNFSVVDSILVGNGPIGICITPDGSKLYVANYGNHSVSVINTATDTISSTIVVGAYPYGICISPDGSRVYVANYSSSTLSVINTASDTVLATISIGIGPMGVSVSPDGSKVYVENEFSNSVSVINTTTNTVSATIYVGNRPLGLGNFISIYPVISTGLISPCIKSPNISLYPNPTFGTFTLSYSLLQSGISNYELSIMDVLGRMVYTQVITNPNQTTINVSQLSNGVYFYQLTNNKETYRGKFIKQ